MNWQQEQHPYLDVVVYLRAAAERALREYQRRRFNFDYPDLEPVPQSDIENEVEPTGQD